MDQHKERLMPRGIAKDPSKDRRFKSNRGRGRRRVAAPVEVAANETIAVNGAHGEALPQFALVKQDDMTKEFNERWLELTRRYERAEDKITALQSHNELLQYQLGLVRQATS